MLPQVQIDGRLVADPELKFTQSGKAVTSLRIAASDSKKDDRGDWQTTEQVFVGASLWEEDAELAAETLRKGDRVIVTGRIYEREYEKRDGGTGKSLELKFPTVAKVIAAKKGAQSSTPRQAAPASDPWSTTPAAGSDEPPF